MNLPTLILELNDIKNQNNPLLNKDRNNFVSEFIWPTTEHGAYFRVTLHTAQEFLEMKEKHMELIKLTGTPPEMCVFNKVPTPTSRVSAKEFVRRVNNTFFKTPIIDLEKFDLRYISVQLEHNLPKGDIFMEDENNFVYQLTSCNVLFDPIT